MDDLPPTPEFLEDSMMDLELCQDGILNLLNDIDPHKATGPDGIPGRVIKECAGILSSFLFAIFDNSLSCGKLPSEWKKAHVVPGMLSLLTKMVKKIG